LAQQGEASDGSNNNQHIKHVHKTLGRCGPAQLGMQWERDSLLDRSSRDGMLGVLRARDDRIAKSPPCIMSSLGH
jgi:hypothetical protein